MREFVKSELSNMDLSEKSVGILWFSFNAVMQQAIDKFVLHTLVTNKPNKPIWMTGKVLRSVKKKTQTMEEMET